MKGLRLGLSLTGGAAAVPFVAGSTFPAGMLGAQFDPQDGATMYQTGTRASPGLAAAVGDPVGLILDTSGNNNDAVQSTAAARPIRRATGLEFDGVDDYLILPTGLLTGWTSGTGMFGAKLDADPPAASGQAGAILGDFGSDASGNHYPWTTGVVIEDFLSTARKDAIAADPGDLAAWHVGDFRSEANSWKAAYNGTDYMTTVTNTVGVGTAPLIGQTGAVNRHDGLIGRIIITNSVLTGSDLSGARTWVAAGHGQTL